MSAPPAARLSRFRPARVRVLLVKELAQIRRNRSLFGILVMAPLIQLIVMGYAVTTDVREIALAVRDHDRTYHSREYVRALGASGYFRTRLLAGPAARDGEELVSARAGLVLVIPAGFGRQLLQRQPAGVQVLVDGADSNFAVHGINYLQKASRLYTERLVRLKAADLAGRRGVRLPSVVAESRAWYNPGLQSTLFQVPGLMGLLLLVTTMMVTSMALVKEREDGTMEQLIVTPLRPVEIILGKLLPFVAVGLVEMTLALIVIRLVFHIAPRGSLLLLYGLSAPFILTSLGLGLFISTLVKTQQQAMMTSAFFVMMPFILLSGFVFPIENMPAAMQAVAQLIPLKYYLIIIRGIFLKGAGWAELWREGLVLLVWGVGILGLAALKFRKRLD
jgi:ABC-2 type transport system permease protein